MRFRTCIGIGLILLTARLWAKGEPPAAPRQPRQVSYCDVAHDPAAYNHKFLRITASVTHGFEDFHLVDPSCASDGFSVWVTYGGKAESNTAYCCPGEPGTGERPEPLRIDGIELPLVRDDVFNQFSNLLAQEPDTTIHATLIGTFFSGRKQTIRGHTFWGGAGHLGCCSLFVVEQVVRFDPDSDSKRVVTVTGTLATRKVVTVKIRLAGKPGELECFRTVPGCIVPRTGKYLILPARNPIYQDCPNVDLFPEAADPSKDKEIGLYCWY